MKGNDQDGLEKSPLIDFRKAGACNNPSNKKATLIAAHNGLFFSIKLTLIVSISVSTLSLNVRNYV